jgi:hypothetical protein
VARRRLSNTKRGLGEGYSVLATEDDEGVEYPGKRRSCLHQNPADGPTVVFQYDRLFCPDMEVVTLKLLPRKIEGQICCKFEFRLEPKTPNKRTRN